MTTVTASGMKRNRAGPCSSTTGEKTMQMAMQRAVKQALASVPFEGHVMLTTRFASGRSSSFKRALRQLPVGAAVEVSEPDGDFVVGDPGEQHVLIAGGIGVTPFRAILLDLDHREMPINATLLYANRTPDFVYKAELDRLASRHPRFVVRYLVSRSASAKLRSAPWRPTSRRRPSTSRDRNRSSSRWEACSRR